MSFSEKVYDNLTKNLVDFGTTTAVYFGTIYPESNLVLAKMCNKNRQRGLIGQVVMDDPDMNQNIILTNPPLTVLLKPNVLLMNYNNKIKRI